MKDSQQYTGFESFLISNVFFISTNCFFILNNGSVDFVWEINPLEVNELQPDMTWPNSTESAQLRKINIKRFRKMAHNIYQTQKQRTTLFICYHRVCCSQRKTKTKWMQLSKKTLVTNTVATAKSSYGSFNCLFEQKKTLINLHRFKINDQL